MIQICLILIISEFICSKIGGESRISRRGTNPSGKGANLLFGNFLKENCMKIKEIGPRGEGAHFPSVPRDPPMNIVPYYNR